MSEPCPAIKPACTRSKTKRVSVLGTKGTVKREYTKALIRDFAQGCDVTLVGSADLASLAEAALSGGEVSDAGNLAEIAPCFVGDSASDPARTDTVVLACTHYPAADGPARQRSRHGRWTGSIRRPRSPGGLRICWGPPAAKPIMPAPK